MSRHAAARRAEHKRERREAILDAAERVFGSRGAQHVTMDEVAEAADVSKGTLYLYFRSKDDLFVALTHRPLDVVLARFEALLEHRGTRGADLLRALLDTHSEVVRAHRSKMRLALATMCSGYHPSPEAESIEAYAERVRALRATYREAIRRGMDDGSLRDDLDPAQVAAALWAANFGASFIRMNAEHYGAMLPEEDRGELEEMPGRVADLLLRALAPHELAPQKEGSR